MESYKKTQQKELRKTLKKNAFSEFLFQINSLFEKTRLKIKPVKNRNRGFKTSVLRIPRNDQKSSVFRFRLTEMGSLVPSKTFFFCKETLILHFI